MARSASLHGYGHASGVTTPTQQTMEQLFREEEVSPVWSSTSSSPPISFGKYQNDPEEDNSQHQKRSVLSKLREKAKKLKYSLSYKQRLGNDENSTPAWGFTLEDDFDEAEEDPEFFGAPMYESELAPEELKETARQHPRANPVISEKHVLPTSVRLSFEDEKHNSFVPNKIITDTISTKPLSPNQTAAPNPSSPKKTLTQSLSEKFSPALSNVTDATYAIASKIQNLTINSSTKTSKPKSPEVVSRNLSAPGALQSKEQIWDKGVSVKEYFIHKFEPGEDEKELSKVITEAISPRKSFGDTNMAEKVKEAVNNLFGTIESFRSRDMKSTTSSVSQFPVSNKAHEFVEDEKHERIIQAN